MNSQLLELLDLTETLLAAARSPNPDLNLVLQLLRERGDKLARLPAGDLSESRERLATFRRILAADAELRDLFQKRQTTLGSEQQTMATCHFGPVIRLDRRRMVDQRI
ncbi:MAG TPA: hypothetical protein VKX96_03910 [Chloroflexota bacterium]|nr:hypothetical protein [Chloroflexota bacterium]